MLRIKAKERKQRAMEAKVEDSERKLAEFNARLTVRKNKVCSKQALFVFTEYFLNHIFSLKTSIQNSKNASKSSRSAKKNFVFLKNKFPIVKECVNHLIIYLWIKTVSEALQFIFFADL